MPSVFWCSRDSSPGATEPKHWRMILQHSAVGGIWDPNPTRRPSGTTRLSPSEGGRAPPNASSGPDPPSHRSRPRIEPKLNHRSNHRSSQGSNHRSNLTSILNPQSKKRQPTNSAPLPPKGGAIGQDDPSDGAGMGRILHGHLARLASDLRSRVMGLLQVQRLEDRERSLSRLEGRSEDSSWERPQLGQAPTCRAGTGWPTRSPAGAMDGIRPDQLRPSQGPMPKGRAWKLPPLNR